VLQLKTSAFWANGFLNSSRKECGKNF
jgi:hypothetical protein